MKKLFNYILRMKRWKQVMLVLVLWAVWGLIDVNNFAKAPTRDATTFTPYQDPAGTVARLSDEVSEPFNNERRNVAHMRKDYDDAVKNFPTVLDCLQKSEWDNPQPNLTEMDWDKIDFNEEAEVCLFRIASSYEHSYASTMKWLYNQGISFYPPETNIENKILIAAGWITRKHGVLFYKTLFDKYFNGWIVWSTSFSVEYNENRNIIATYVADII